MFNYVKYNAFSANDFHEYPLFPNTGQLAGNLFYYIISCEFNIVLNTVNVDIFVCIHFSRIYENWQFCVDYNSRFKYNWLFRLL